MLLVDAIWDRGRWVGVTLWMTAHGNVLAGCKKALFGRAGHFSSLFYKQISKMIPSSCRDSIFGTVGSFQSGRAFAGQTALDIERLLMSRCGQGHGLVDAWIFHWVKFPGRPPQRTYPWSDF